MPEEKTDDKIVLQVDMHCEGCKDKVRRALKCFPGLEKIEVDMKEHKVTVKGKLDAKKVYETVKKKSGRRTVLLYPDLKKVEEESKNKEEPKKEEAPPPPDPEVVVVLKVNMHCGGCAKQIKKNLEKMCGVSEVSVDVANSQVTVKGKNIDPQKVCGRVRKSGKPCEIVPPPPPPPPPPEEPKKEEPAKEEPKKEEEKPADEKKEEEKPAEEKKEEEKPAEEKKEEEKPAEEVKKEGEGEEKSEEKKEEKSKEKEEKSEEKKEEKKEEAPPPAEDDTKVEVKKYQYIPSSYYRTVHEYVYPPQLFSDENPNACSVM